MMEDFLGHGIFNSDGEDWKWQRKTASYEFNKRSLRNFVIETVHFEITNRLLPILNRAAEKGVKVELQDVLERFAFDNICRVIIGEDPACLTEEDKEAFSGTSSSKEFMAAFSDAQVHIPYCNSNRETLLIKQQEVDMEQEAVFFLVIHCPMFCNSIFPTITVQTPHDQSL